ncbi:hypothetical protein [Qipengyuania vesicularis]|uniref:hypothetical protein n=1 Tax=Qipengyuania vesicularis TaxID=2867232 RepID=UPI001C86A801|nr:hypothetical protein [Qipengyuania vesicularis]MBX7526547.1 hypothetical protein [Qipengyuania vesicularis]
MEYLVAALILLALLAGVGMLAAHDWRKWRDRKAQMEARWRRKRTAQLGSGK